MVNGDLISENALEVLQLPAAFLPKLVVAIVVFAIGLIIAWLAQRLIEAFFKAVPIFDETLRNIGLEEITRRAGIHINLGRFFGIILRVFVIVIALVMSFDILGFEQINTYLIDSVLVGFIPMVVKASVILILGLIIANFVSNFVTGVAQASKVDGGLAAGIAKYAIIVLSVIAALSELGIGEFVGVFVSGFIAAISLALGLAFGLGGQQAASELLEKVRSDMRRR